MPLRHWEHTPNILHTLRRELLDKNSPLLDPGFWRWFLVAKLHQWKFWLIGSLNECVVDTTQLSVWYSSRVWLRLVLTLSWSLLVCPLTHWKRTARYFSLQLLLQTQCWWIGKLQKPLTKQTLRYLYANRVYYLHHLFHYVFLKTMLLIVPFAQNF